MEESWLNTERGRAEVLEALGEWLQHCCSEDGGVVEARVERYERMTMWVRRANGGEMSK